MLKTLTLAVLVGAVTVTTVLPGAAAVVVRRPGNTGNGQDCADSMGHMRSVKAADIDAIQNQRVALLTVCDDMTVGSKNAYGSLFVDGNVNHLRQPIAHNAALMAALTAKGYDQNDVVSLRFGGNDSIILYVHQRDMN